MSRFKLLRGVHQQTEVVAGESCPNCENGKRSDGKPCISCKSTGIKHVNATYKKGDVFESPIDLDVKYGDQKFLNLDRVASEDSSGMRKRISELEAEVASLRSGNVPTGATGQPSEDPADLILPENIGEMEVDELKTFAKEMGIDLGTASKKSDILKVIKKAVGEMAPA